MTMNKKTALLVALVAGLSTGVCTSGVAQLQTNTFSFTPNVSIPDNSPAGVVNVQTIATPIMAISNVSVTLNISGGYVGDLYGYLTDGSQLAILLNREGRTVSNPYGYLDSGLNVTLSDSAANGDIHSYQLVSNPGGGALTGIWAPDARLISPYNSLDTTPRTAFLSSFTGLNPNGNWTLYLADFSPVGSSTLNSWSLQVVGVVPEPTTWYLLGAGLFLTLCLRRKKA